MVVNSRMEQLNCDIEREKLMSQYVIFKKLYETYSPITKELSKIYSCERCGKCCREERVLLGSKEVGKFAKLSGDKFADYVEKDVGKGVYLKLPCPYLEEGNGKCICRVNHAKPLVCQNYPFMFLYGYFVSLVYCPYGNKIINDMNEFNKEMGIVVGEETADNKISEMKRIENDINNFYDKIGVKTDTGSKILNMSFDYLVLFYKWIKKRNKYNKRREKEGKRK